VPRWVCSSSCCGLDLFSIVGSLIIFIMVVHSQTAISFAAAIAFLLVMIFATMPIVTCERLAHARRRRNECVFCGKALEKRESENFRGCECRHDPTNTPHP
jgi:hypothetical protein